MEAFNWWADDQSHTDETETGHYYDYHYGPRASHIHVRDIAIVRMHGKWRIAPPGAGLHEVTELEFDSLDAAKAAALILYKADAETSSRRGGKNT